MHDSDIPEDYITLIQVLAEDEQLREWFASLSTLPANRRYSELGHLSVQFHDVGRKNLGRVILSLNDEKIYGMVRGVVDSYQT